MWSPGDVITRREVLGFSPIDETRDPIPPWHGKAWLELPVRVVEDTADHLATYIAPRAPFHFPEGEWPAPGHRHPWQHRDAWQGNGCLMVQRPGEHHAVWHFWHGPDRRFSHWYINLQTAFRRTPIGYDTQDLELDLVVSLDGSWVLKDDDVIEDRVREGRLSVELVRWVRDLAGRLGARLDAGDHWWDPAWAEWTPPGEWSRQQSE